MFDSATQNNNNYGPCLVQTSQWVPLFDPQHFQKQPTTITGPQIGAVFPQKSEIFTQTEMDLHNHVLFLFAPVVIYLTDFA